MIHLKHAEHGYHIVYTEADAKLCERTGWKRCDIEEEHKIAREAKESARKSIKAEQELGEEIAAQASKRKRRTKAEMELANDHSTAN